MPKPRAPRLYTLFGMTLRPGDPEEEYSLIENVPKVRARSAYRDEVRRMRLAGFHVIERKDEADNLPHAIVRNPRTGLNECEYWLRETA